MPKAGCSNQGKYPDVPKKYFCGPAGGACPGTYPVNTPGRARAAKAYARHAPNPEGIKKCADRIAKREGWGAGKSSEKTVPKRKSAKGKKSKGKKSAKGRGSGRHVKHTKSRNGVVKRTYGSGEVRYYKLKPNGSLVRISKSAAL